MSPSEFEAQCHHNSTCALTGSAAFFDSIPGSFTLINGPLWCYFYAMKWVDDEQPMAGQRFYCTMPSPNSLVYGTEKDLRGGFDYIQKYAKPDRVFVENNCSVSLVGDDVQGIAESLDLPWPVYAMDSGGMKGNFEGGFTQASLRVEKEMKPLAAVPHSVNVLGLTTSYLKGKEDTAEIRRLLSLMDIPVISMPGAGDSWDTIMQAPSASLNLVVRDELGLKLAEQMKEDFGIPYISVGLPYGYEGTLAWAGKVQQALESGTLERLEAEKTLHQRELKRKGNNLESLWGPLWFDRILVSAPPSEALGIAEAVRSEWADTADLTIHLQAASDKSTPAAGHIRRPGVDDVAMKEDFAGWTGGLVIGSSHEISRLLRLHKPFTAFQVTRPNYDEMFFSDVPFCGLRGAAYLYELLWNAKIREKMGEKSEVRGQKSE